MRIPSVFYILLGITGTGFTLLGYGFYQFWIDGMPPSLTLFGLGVTLYGWFAGLRLCLPGRQPPHNPPRPHKPTPSPLHPQGLVFYQPHILKPNTLISSSNPLPTYKNPVISPPSNPPCAACPSTGW